MTIPPIAADAETINTRARIVQLLERVRRSRLELHAAVPGSDHIWRTTISRVDADESTIIYQQLTPSTWKEANLAQGAEVHCLAPGCRLAYSEVLTVIEDSSICYFESALPSKLLYHQARRLFRVSVTSRPSEILIDNGGQSLEGELLDVSEGGCRARLDTVNDDLCRGRFIEECRVRIEGILDINCQVEVCHSQIAGETQEVGLAFHGLEPRAAQQLQKCVTDLQRANLRRGVVSSV